ncbi:MAG: Flp pilus assembly complex ATPase component TadA, partial [Planctomycetales bacterium]|nr:Flp pilus assembly complex ATPase component TadA [Planctomycetales bacterium]
MISTAGTPNSEGTSSASVVPRAARPTRFDRPARPLGEQLVDAHIISQAELESALAMQSQRGLRIGELLMELGIVDEETLLPFIEQQLGVPAVRLREGLLDPTAVKVIPRALAERLHVVGMFLVRDTLTVALSDPQNLQKLDEIERLSGYRVNPVFVFAPALARMLKRCYEEDFEVDAVTADFDRSSVELQADITDVSITAIERMVDGSPVINLVNYLILQAIRRAASDIHIEPGRKYTVVRFRIDGQLVEVLRPRRDIHPAVVSRVKVMAKMDIAEQRMPQDGRCQVAVEGKEVDLRVSTLPTVLGEKVVMRVLDRRRLTFNLDRLGFTHDLLTKFKQLLAKPHGLLLVTGPTGSGKTTTLYSALELIKSVHRNIVTVEDPVEYQL